jgi:hypothetical protein
LILRPDLVATAWHLPHRAGVGGSHHASTSKDTKHSAGGWQWRDELLASRRKRTGSATASQCAKAQRQCDLQALGNHNESIPATWKLGRASAGFRNTFSKITDRHCASRWRALSSPSKRWDQGKARACCRQPGNPATVVTSKSCAANARTMVTRIRAKDVFAKVRNVPTARACPRADPRHIDSAMDRRDQVTATSSGRYLPLNAWEYCRPSQYHAPHTQRTF